MKNLTIVFALLILWIYVLSIFKRRKMSFFYFMVGAVGLFAFSFFLFEPIFTAPLAKLVCYLTGLMGELTGFFKAYASYGVLFIENINGPVSLYVDFECAGLVEVLVFMALIAFFFSYSWWQKILVVVSGFFWILFANVVRLTVICCIICWLGNESYYIAHTVIGRIVFYLLSLWFYFLAFTKRQVRQQKVGEFDYDAKSN
ncbi:MAG: exosortase family protein XrtG [Acetatifactor sp.]